MISFSFRFLAIYLSFCLPVYLSFYFALVLEDLCGWVQGWERKRGWRREG